MLKVTILLPAYYNDGTRIPSSIGDSLCYRIREIAGGYTRQARCTGCYTADNGDVQVDTCDPIVVVLFDTSKLNILRQVAKNAAVCLRQESIYFEVQEVQVEFVRA